MSRKSFSEGLVSEKLLINVSTYHDAMMRFAKQIPYIRACEGVNDCFCQVSKNSSLVMVLFSGCSVVWLARLLWEQEAVSSNLTIPTIFPFYSSPYTFFNWVLYYGS